MKKFSKWLDAFLAGTLAVAVFSVWLIFREQYVEAAAALVILLVFAVSFLGLWYTVRKKGIQTEVEISRVLGKDAKDALSFGNIGLITYNEEYVATWTSSYFKDHDIDLVNKKLTSWIENIRDLFEEDVDIITGVYKGQVYEVEKKADARILYVKNITELTQLRSKLQAQSTVVGFMTLDNYNEYLSYENEEILNMINSGLRSSLIGWAKVNKMFIRRVRSDRFLVLCNVQTLMKVRRDNFPILQKIKDEADKMDVSITLSMVFCYGTEDFLTLDQSLNELLELVASRGGDQVAIKKIGEKVEFIGGNSEKSSQRSKVRVGVIAASMQDLIEESGKIFILGHQNSDFDCMGAALAMSNWCRALGKEAYIVLKDVSRDRQLQETMDHYRFPLSQRHALITQEEALRMLEPSKDLVVMVDHGVPAISSGPLLLEKTGRVAVVDHHRRSENFVKTPVLSYVESQASSTCELVTEMVQSSSVSVPIYELEATIMYLGVLVDTNRFKSHTSERTFQAAATLRSWGANAPLAEMALQEDIDHFRLKSEMVQKAQPYRGRFMISVSDQPVSRTLMSQVSDALLLIKGSEASFTVAVNKENGKVAVSARSNGGFNVQKVMEKMNGGGHFSAAALEREGSTPAAVAAELKAVLDEEE